MSIAHGDPLVSVVIPCFNQAAYLPASIASVRRQTHRPAETIIVDDGSTDESGRVAAAVGARVIRQPNSGVAAARNVGLSAAGGAYVVFLDADDELLPSALESGVAALEHRPEAACVVRWCQLMDAAGRPVETDSPDLESDDVYREWLLRNFIWTPGAAMFRRDRLLAIGGFPVEVSPAADYAVYLRLARDREVVVDPHEVVRYRQHGANMSRDPLLMLRATLEVLRRERPYLPPSYESAFSTGRQAWCVFYGDQIIQRLRADWRARRLGRWHLKAFFTLAYQCPSVLLMHTRRKTWRVLRGLPPTDVTVPVEAAGLQTDTPDRQSTAPSAMTR